MTVRQEKDDICNRRQITPQGIYLNHGFSSTKKQSRIRLRMLRLSLIRKKSATRFSVIISARMVLERREEERRGTDLTQNIDEDVVIKCRAVDDNTENWSGRHDVNIHKLERVPAAKQQLKDAHASLNLSPHVCMVRMRRRRSLQLTSLYVCKRLDGLSPRILRGPDRPEAQLCLVSERECKIMCAITS